MKTEKMPDMLSCEMASIARQDKKAVSIGELVLDARDAVKRAQDLTIEHPNDPNAAMLELNLAFGLLETINKNASIETLDTELL